MKNALYFALISVVFFSACAPGRNGENGTQGAPGAVGPNGTPAPPTTLVQLCPGAPAYSTTYIENAICLQGQLYGVYSANGGFLTLLTPGAYTSNGIGSSCNFTVGLNCAISY